jgi:hypothetical protein
MNWKSESLALVFGMLIIFMIFGDAAHFDWVGNLDTIFGLRYWHLMDVLYPLTSIVVFLLYGKSKGSLHFRRTSIRLFVVFLIAIVIMQFDDIFVVFNHPIILPDIYWTTDRCLYLFTAITTFFAFGRSCRNKSPESNQRKTSGC